MNIPRCLRIATLGLAAVATSTACSSASPADVACSTYGDWANEYQAAIAATMRPGGDVYNAGGGVFKDAMNAAPATMEATFKALVDTHDIAAPYINDTGPVPEWGSHEYATRLISIENEKDARAAVRLACSGAGIEVVDPDR